MDQTRPFATAGWIPPARRVLLPRPLSAMKFAMCVLSKNLNLVSGRRVEAMWKSSAILAIVALLLEGVCKGQSPRSSAPSGESAEKAQRAISLVQQGITYARSARYRLAELAYGSALGIDPHCLPAQINLGLAYFKSNDYEHAIQPLEQAVKEGVDSDQVHTLMAMSLYALHRYDAASRHYEVLFNRQPTNTMLEYLLAESYMRSHQTGRLPGFMQQLQATAPDSPVIYMLAGEQFDRLGQTDKAIDEFLKAEAAAPKMPMVHFALGYFYWEQHLMDKAAEQFRAEAGLKDGEVSQAAGYLGDIALSDGEDSEAERILRESLAIDPTVRIAQYDLGVICAQAAKASEAIEHFELAVKLDPQRADAYYQLARVYGKLGKHDQQRALLAQVKHLHKTEHATLASVYQTHSEK
jgi:tetratricopeptide (TPR) repeat protein